MSQNRDFDLNMGFEDGSGSDDSINGSGRLDLNLVQISDDDSASISSNSENHILEDGDEGGAGGEGDDDEGDDAEPREISDNLRMNPPHIGLMLEREVDFIQFIHGYAREN